MPYIGTQTDSNATHVPAGGAGASWGTGYDNASTTHSCLFGDGDTAGVTGEVCTVAALSTENAYYMESDSGEPGITTWEAPSASNPYYVRLNISVGQFNTDLVEVHVVRLDVSGNYEETLASLTGLTVSTNPDIDYTGVITSGNAGGTSGDAVLSTDRIGVVWVFANDDVVSRNITILPNRNIDAPITGRGVPGRGQDYTDTRGLFEVLLAAESADSTTTATQAEATRVIPITAVCTTQAATLGNNPTIIPVVFADAVCTTHSETLGNNPTILGGTFREILAQSCDHTDTVAVTTQVTSSTLAISSSGSAAYASATVVRAAQAVTTATAELVGASSEIGVSPLFFRGLERTESVFVTTQDHHAQAQTTATVDSVAAVTEAPFTAEATSSTATETRAQVVRVRSATAVCTTSADAISNPGVFGPGTSFATVAAIGTSTSYVSAPATRVVGAQTVNNNAANTTAGLAVAKRGAQASASGYASVQASVVRVRSISGVVSTETKTDATITRPVLAQAVVSTQAQTRATTGRVVQLEGVLSTFTEIRADLSRIAEGFIDDLFVVTHTETGALATVVRGPSAKSTTATGTSAVLFRIHRPTAVCDHGAAVLIGTPVTPETFQAMAFVFSRAETNGRLGRVIRSPIARTSTESIARLSSQAPTPSAEEQLAIIVYDDYSEINVTPWGRR